MVKSILKTGGVALAGVVLLAGCQTAEPTRAQMDAAAYQSMQNIEVVRQTETAYQEKLDKQAADEAAAKAKADRARANANAKAAKVRAEKQKKIDAYNQRMKEIELELKELDLLEPPRRVGKPHARIEHQGRKGPSGARTPEERSPHA